MSFDPRNAELLLSSRWLEGLTARAGGSVLFASPLGSRRDGLSLARLQLTCRTLKVGRFGSRRLEPRQRSNAESMANFRLGSIGSRTLSELRSSQKGGLRAFKSRLGKDPSLCESRHSSASPNRSLPDAGRSSRGSLPREFSGMQFDEVVHAHRLLACELEQILGHAVIAALLG
jgi:hypothetical protein